YMIRGAGEFIPDPVHFTVLWLSESFAESAFDFEDSANEFLATLDPDAPLDRVIEGFDRELDGYGAVGAYGVEDQLSNRYLSDEIKGLRGSATITPTIFLGVAAFVLHMLLGRLVRTQRTEIAVFRAFGYGTADIVLHYLKLSALVGVVGAVLGIAAGVYFAKAVLVSYQQFYQFPLLRFDVDPLVVFSGLLVCLGFAVLGAASAARKAARLHPAEGLRPEAPGVYRRTLLERWPRLFAMLGPIWRMVVRHVARAKLRSALTVSGVALAGSIVFLALFSSDSMDALVDNEANVVDLHDARINFNSDLGRAALYEVRRIPGVTRAEPELIVPVRLVNGWRHKRVAIIGLDSEGELRGLVDRDRNPVPKPRSGLLLTKKLAEILDVAKGDELEARVLEGKKQVLRLPVEGTVDEFLGASAYADHRVLSRWVGEEEAMNSVRLLVDDDLAEELSLELKSLPAVESVRFKSQVVQNFRDTLAASMGIMISVITVFAGIIAFGVIYNSSRIALAERERTLASLRVLGFTEGEVSSIIVRENLLLTAAGILPGLGLGILWGVLLSRVYDTDLYRFPIVIREQSLLLTALAVVVFAILANLAVRRRVKRLDIVEALKSRE
ncbi:MAG: ABC transporter permease, partial [Planctomycetota bacterium]